MCIRDSTGTIYAAPSLTPGINTCDPRGPVDLVPQNRTHSLFVSARQELSSAVTVWADLLYSDRKDIVQAALPGQTFVLLTAANPFFRPPPGTGTTYELSLIHISRRQRLFRPGRLTAISAIFPSGLR